jgi:transcriptional regulator with XRE-family HTH domain
VTPSLSLHLWTMDFGTRLAMLRKQRTMTQQTLADAAGCHVTMIRRYEANETQPTLEVIRNMARALSVSADSLVFEQDERGPSQELLLQFEAVSQLLPAEQAVVKDVLESLIIKYQTRRWDAARLAAAAPAKTATAKKPSATPRKKDAPNKRAAQATTR